MPSVYPTRDQPNRCLARRARKRMYRSFTSLANVLDKAADY